MTVDQQFTTINDKLQLLLKNYARLQRENEKLKDELSEAHNRETETKSKIEELEQRLSIMKLTTPDVSDTDKKEFEKKINQYIREIDKCISYLSQ